LLLTGKYLKQNQNNLMCLFLLEEGIKTIPHLIC